MLLHDRVAAVREDLLEIATTLERAPAPDPVGVAELQRLLADGCESPLYNADIHVSELRATHHTAEREGFEPSMDGTAHTGFRDLSVTDATLVGEFGSIDGRR